MKTTKHIPTKNSIKEKYYVNKIVQSKKKVLKLDLLMTGVVLIGIIGTILTF
jgi:hypothetical protein